MGRFLNADAYASTGQGVLGNNMFAYCNNDPVNMIDPAGTIAWALLPWHIIIPAIIAGGGGFVSSLISGDSIGQALYTGLTDAAIAALIAANPSLAIIFTSVGYLELLIDCLYQGMTFEESVIAIGLSTASNIGLPSSGDTWTDLAVEATFGTAKGLFCDVGEELFVNGNADRTNPEAITCGILSLFTISSSGGGCLGMMNICFQMNGGQSLCYRP